MTMVLIIIKDHIQQTEHECGMLIHDIKFVKKLLSQSVSNTCNPQIER